MSFGEKCHLLCVFVGRSRQGHVHCHSSTSTVSNRRKRKGVVSTGKSTDNAFLLDSANQDMNRFKKARSRHRPSSFHDVTDHHFEK